MASLTTEQPTGAGTLWRDENFLKLWAGQSLSLVGSQMTILAMPIVAFVLLGASVAEMGYLGALGRLPMVLFLVVGVWIDRMRRRSVLIVSNLTRAVLLVTVPLLFFVNGLALWWLYVVVFGCGVLGVFFEIAYRSYLPNLVRPELLGEGNSKLQLSESVAGAAGPSLAGLLAAARSAPLAILIDAVTYLVSSISLLFIRKREDKPEVEPDRGSIVTQIGQGMRWVMAQPLIRPLAISSAVYSFFDIGILQTLYFPFAVKEVHVPAAWVGGVLATGGVGAIVGAWLAVRLMKSAGPGPTMTWCIIVGNSSMLLVPLAGGPRWLGVGMLGLSQLVVGLTSQIFVVNNITVLQSATPREMAGRVISTIWALGLVPAPLGALLAGLIGQSVGLRPVVAVAALIGAVVPMVVLVTSPVPKLRRVPEAPLPA